jgi:uncharacterized protein YndB with AHSA1/START domain
MKRIEVNLSRVIPAAPAEVFDLWLDPKSPGGPWFGSERVILNPVVDGLFYHAVVHEGRTWAHYGRFLRLDRGRLVEHTWMSEATQGIETTVRIALEAKGNDTLLTLRHSDLPDDEMGRRHEEGWKFIAGALADGMASRRRSTG